MMAGRAHRAEGVVGLAGDDGVDRGGHRAGRAQRRLARGRRQHRVGVDRDMARFRDGGEQALDMAARMDPQQVVDRRLRRLAPLEAGELRRRQRRQHRAQPRRRFRVMAAGIVIEAGLVGIEQGRHRSPSQTGCGECCRSVPPPKSESPTGPDAANQRRRAA